MIEINNIYKSFGKELVLDGVSFSCKYGKIQGLLGVNGAGKSTLINVLAGLMKSEKGTIKINNEIVSVNSFKQKRVTGYVFEYPMYIDKLTSSEYLTFVAKMQKIKNTTIKSRVEELIDFFSLPKSKKLIENYSKGMKRKVSLAGALIHKPKYLILDEPFEGLDFSSSQKVSRLFKQLSESGVTILITSHQFDLIANICDSFAVLKGGKILFNKTLQELKEDSKPNKLKVYLEHLMGDNIDSTISFYDR